MKPISQTLTTLAVQFALLSLLAFGGANAVVLSDVPPGRTAVGIPARVIERAPASRVADMAEEFAITESRL